MSELNIKSSRSKKKININSEKERIDNFEITEYIIKEISNEELSQKYQIRNFSYPVSLQTEENRQKYISKDYEPHLKHYSTSRYVYFYLLRNYPFLEAKIQDLDIKKEIPNRLFSSMEQCFRILRKNFENREAIPELFSNFDYYCNLNCAFLGIQENGTLVDDLRTNFENDIMDNLYSTYLKYVYIFRRLLNSYLISQYLPT